MDRQSGAQAADAALGQAARVKFLRHLAAATLVVAAVVVLGLAWNHFAASTLAGGLQGTYRQEIAASQPAPKVIHRSGTINLGLGSMLNPVNLPNLRHTVVIEVGVIAAVVIIDASRRKSRRIRRAGQPAPPQPSDNDGTDQ
jgi:hypothetical protein